MSSNKNRDNKKNYTKKNNRNDNANSDREKQTDEDLEECDKILEQLDKMEQGKEDISSKVKNLIKSDKEAIKKMQEEIANMDEDLDYLDDEKIEDIPEDNDRKTENKKNTKRENINKNKENINSEKRDNRKKDGGRKAGKKNVGVNADEISKQESENDDSDSGEEDVKLDFFANLEQEDKKERIRKKQPNRLHGSSDLSGGIKNIFLSNRKYFYIGTAIAVLFIVLIVALALDSGNAEKSSKKGINTEFLKMDTTPMIDAINSYYAALSGDDVSQVRSYLMDNETVTDEEIARKSEEIKVYAELISSSFLITDCYVQQGLKDNEYIAYMKFQIQIKSIETPAVGIFTCYFVDNSEDGKADYKIGINVNDKTTDVYKHMVKMRNCSNVIKLFEDVDKELEEACSKDENLRAVVEALENPEQENTDEEQPVDDSTTAPMENAD